MKPLHPSVPDDGMHKSRIECFTCKHDFLQTLKFSVTNHHKYRTVTSHTKLDLAQDIVYTGTGQGGDAPILQCPYSQHWPRNTMLPATIESVRWLQVVKVNLLVDIV
jgi:hypothetical protein